MGMNFEDKVTFFAPKASSVMNTPLMDIETVFSFERFLTEWTFMIFRLFHMKGSLVIVNGLFRLKESSTFVTFNSMFICGRVLTENMFVLYSYRSRRQNGEF